MTSVAGTQPTNLYTESTGNRPLIESEAPSAMMIKLTECFTTVFPRDSFRLYALENCGIPCAKVISTAVLIGGFGFLCIKIGQLANSIFKIYEGENEPIRNLFIGAAPFFIAGIIAAAICIAKVSWEGGGRRDFEAWQAEQRKLSEKEITEAQL